MLYTEAVEGRMAETNPTVAGSEETGVSIWGNIPCIKRVVIKSSLYEIYKDPTFSERLKGHPSPFYSYGLNYFKPGSFDKHTFKTNNILKKFSEDRIYVPISKKGEEGGKEEREKEEEQGKDSEKEKPADIKDFPWFYELVEEYNGQFSVQAKPFLIDALTWRMFMQPHSIALIKEEAEKVLEDFKQTNTSRKKAKQSREGVHFETCSKGLEIVITVTTKFLQKNKNNRNESQILMLQLSYEFEKDGKAGGLGKVQFPLDLFLLYLEKDAEKFYLSCSTKQVSDTPEKEVKTATRKAKKPKLSAEEPKKRQRQLSSTSTSEDTD